jgi:hypothetical protein
MTPLAAAALLDVVDEEAAGAAALVLDEDAGGAAALVLELLELPHPAMIRAAVASAAAPTMRNLAVLRMAILSSQFAVFTGPVKWTDTQEDPGSSKNLPAQL